MTIADVTYPGRVLPASAPLPPVPPVRQVLRAARLGIAFARAAAVVAAGTLDPRTARPSGPGTAERLLVATLHRAGPAAVKLAQLVGTRADLVPERFLRPLATLHDDAPPIPAARAATLLRSRLGTDPASVFRHVDPEPVASGSIASVYRAVLLDGTEVAVKLRRPGIARLIAADLALLRAGAGLIARTPMLRGIPTVAAVEQLATAIAAQLDLGREAAALTALADALAEVDGVVVPRPHPAFAGCTGAGLLVMDWVPGLARYGPEELGEAGPVCVERGLEAHYRLLFTRGLVHCDLHPGNLYLCPDGSVVLLDAGFVVELPDAARRAFTEFFLRMGTGNAPRCAEIVLATAVPDEGFDEAAYRRDMTELIGSVTGARAHEFALLTFAARLFDLQRRHGLHADPEFAFPLLSLLVLEGTIARFHPAVDFQRLALPHVMGALHRDWAAA